MATPSAKPGATPTHLSSPHPSSAPLSRSLAHKSPSMRTPTGSGPAHAHHTSVSSPSALLALGGYTGISPSPVVHDGLVGAGMNESDIQNLGMQGIKLGVARDNDEEQRHRVEEVVQLLRARVSDRFYPGQDVVKDVSLRYATPEYTEGVRREEATAVLKRTLAQSPEDAECGKWRSLEEFHENLQWLAKLDKLSQEVNCFEALENLEENLRRIWVEESKNGKHMASISIFVQVSSDAQPKGLESDSAWNIGLSKPKSWIRSGAYRLRMLWILIRNMIEPRRAS
ncbi:hypothetical protein PDIDSM_2085 [Penicillium digitatum]|nr:hypothetical protein PDIDSM_7319 [Penicillium digitatum]KAG0161672.1 hypothetical protein PDIDSM_2085 [Penicillium digitatum]